VPTFTNSSVVTYTIKYLGRETVTVPAGTFENACKFQTNDNVIYWEVVGKGVLARSISTTNTGDVLLELKSATINGSSIN
jgi:hypothetical protein